MIINKYKLLRVGHFYSSQEGDFVIGLLGGNRKSGYLLVASYAHSNVVLGRIYVQSRVVPNDGHWMEIDPETYKIASILHASGHRIKFPTKGEELPIITKA
jgi:hypothetical protein